jgi:hypothetical protein
MDEVIHQHRYAGCKARRGLDKNDDLIVQARFNVRNKNVPIPILSCSKDKKGQGAST